MNSFIDTTDILTGHWGSGAMMTAIVGAAMTAC